MLVSAHRAGAVIAALWCNARRAAGPAEALIMADPDSGPARPDRAARRCRSDELSRWRGAYLSADLRDQLLVR